VKDTFSHGSSYRMGNIPEPWNENDVLVWTGHYGKYMCRQEKDTFHRSEFLFNEEIRMARAYDYEDQKHEALYNDDHHYGRLVSHCLTWFTQNRLLREERIRDNDGSEFSMYRKTQALLRLCQEILRYQLPDIRSMLQAQNQD
jgi:hypothetical protein